MTQKQSLLFFLLASLLVGLMYSMASRAKGDFFAQKERLELFSKDAKSLAALKSKFADKKSKQRTIKRLEHIATASKDFKKSDARVLVYEDLSANVLANLLRKIQNSTLAIKKLEIDRQSAAKATLRLEIKR